VPVRREAGCRVSGDRPTCCRIYPLARAVALDGRGEPTDFFFVVAEAGASCLGFGAPGRQTADDWARGQGLDEYRAANDRIARLLLHPRRPRPMSLAEAIARRRHGALQPDVFRELGPGPAFAGGAGFRRRVARRWPRTRRSRAGPGLARRPPLRVRAAARPRQLAGRLSRLRGLALHSR
jgi:hypothetical protein